jgi:TRAP transporter TAXI family solute receptor
MWTMRHLAIASLLAALAAALPPAQALAAEGAPLVIGTGVPGGVYHPLGAALCRLFNLGSQPGGTPCAANPSLGSVANLEALRAGRVVFALSQPDAADAAFRGQGSFAAAGPDAQLRAVLALHVEAFTVIARASSRIRSFEDLKGKRVSVGNAGSGQYLTQDRLLAAAGWTPAMFGRALQLGPAEQNRALCEGRLDAAFFFVGHPNALVLDLMASCPIRLVEVAGPAVDKLIAQAPYYEKVVMAGGLYPGNPEPTATFGARTLLLATAATPDEAVCRLIRAVVDYFDVFRRLHPVLNDLQPADLVPHSTAVPLHPGAERCFKQEQLL